jgi:DNA-binding transcriptional LysR family regulator
MVLNFNSDSIELFLAVIERGSFSAAARALGKVPSAVSMSIANLEAELGYPLFDRSHREPQPTAMANALVPHARLIADQLKQLQVHAVELSLGLESKLSIGAVADIDRRRLLAAIKVIAERHPLLDIEVLTAPQDDVLAMLHSGRINVCLAFAGLSMNAQERFQFVGSERMIATLAADSPLLQGQDLFLRIWCMCGRSSSPAVICQSAKPGHWWGKVIGAPIICKRPWRWSRRDWAGVTSRCRWCNHGWIPGG